MRPSFMRSDIHHASKHSRIGKPGKTPAQVGGVRPLSRMHPDHPVRNEGDMLFFRLEAPINQKFVP